MRKFFNVCCAAIVCTAMMSSCQKGEEYAGQLPTVTTGAPTEITANSVSIEVTVSGEDITDRGVCYSTEQEPTIDDMVLSEGKDVGKLTSTITELIPETVYYVRGYATNPAGTAYSETQTFTTIAIDETIEFSDPIFEQYCLTEFDANNDGKISFSEAKRATNITINQKGISSIDEIHYFTELTQLVCNDNNLTSIDVSKNARLTMLYCQNNKLTSINVNNSKLENLNVDNNQLTTLDLSGSPRLTTLKCDDNQLSTLDISKCPALTDLYCQANQLSELNLSRNTKLTILACSSNPMTSLDVTKNTALTGISCSACQLTSLDLTYNTALEMLICDDNLFTTLDVSSATALLLLYCYDNPHLETLVMGAGQSISNLNKDDHTQIITK